MTAKQLLRDALERLPDDATAEDVMDRLYFLAKAACGLEAAERGEFVPQEEARRLILGETTDAHEWPDSVLPGAT